MGHVRHVANNFISLKICELVQVASITASQPARDATNSESGSITPFEA
jgi:hypothetical protein